MHPPYYAMKNSTLKIDFVIEMGRAPVLMEVKSGRNKRAKSLRTMMQDKDRNRIGYKVMDSNIGTDENGIIHLPLYAPCFFEDCQIRSLPLPPSSKKVNKAFLERENDV